MIMSAVAVSLRDEEARVNTNQIYYEDVTLNLIMLVSEHKYREESRGLPWTCSCAACDWAHMEIERRRRLRT